jgi:signal transduction histidine kinase
VLGGGIAVSAGLVFAFWPIPSPYFPGFPIGRPQEVVWAILLMVTLLGHLREGSWRHDAFRHWLVLSLIVGITAQVAMAVSSQFDDAMFAAAHVLKVASYLLVLVGLLIWMNRLFHMAEASPTRLERMVTERTRELAARNEDLRRFAAVAAHDLREPLTSIRMFGEELAEATSGTLSGWAGQCLDRIRESAARMQQMIDALLALTDVTTRTEAFHPTDLNTVLVEVVSDISNRLDSSGGRVDVGPLPTVDADAAQMRMLFQNLLVNAVKFQRDGVSPLVVVEAESGDGDPAAGPGWVTVTVRDNGIGFPEDQADKIFEVFQRLHGRGEYEGTGIGLAISRRIVERHGGTITASSFPGNGAVMQIVLPTTQSTFPRRYPLETR